MTKARTLADNFAADINGITAGTGITGGGTSGTVTVTNSMATAIDAKGDLVVGTGADTFSRLAVASTAGYLLAVDSGETTGLKWVAPAAASAVGAQAVRTSTQGISINTNVAISWSSAPTNTDSIWAGGAATRFTIPSGKGGKWFFNANLTVNNVAGQFAIKFYKNGAAISDNQTSFFTSSSNITGGSMSAFLTLAATDYVEVFINSTGATEVVGNQSHASLFYVGA